MAAWATALLPAWLTPTQLKLALSSSEADAMCHRRSVTSVNTWLPRIQMYCEGSKSDYNVLSFI